MSYPALGDYQAAIQNPQLVFKDSELAGSTVEVGSLGMPRPRSGGFAVTYRVSKGSRSWAVRCFNREVPDRAQRYAAISTFLESCASPAFVQFEYLPDEMLVGGRRFPVVKMAWIEGQTLGSYVNAHAANGRKLTELAAGFTRVIDELDGLGVAHGDLQHGNILIRDGQVILIDYDGMYVPGMAFNRSNELGHVNYQSPLRTERDFNRSLDRFSAIVIALGLEAIAVDPRLWPSYGAGGENILFQRQDFLKPQESDLIKGLKAIPSLRKRSDQFELLCRTPLDKLPRLHEFFEGTSTISSTQTVSLPDSALRVTRQYPVFLGTDRGGLLLREGRRIEVVGQVVGVKRMMTRTGYPSKPYAMIDFGDWTAGHFRLLIWSEGLQQFAAAGIDVERFDGRWVSVTGLLEVFRSGNATARPQIIVSEPTEIRMLSGKAEADRILTEGEQGYQTSHPTSEGSGRNTAIRDRLKNAAGTASPHRGQHVAPTPAHRSSPSTTRTGRGTRTTNQDIARELATGKPGVMEGSGNTPTRNTGAAQGVTSNPGPATTTVSVTKTQTTTTPSGAVPHPPGGRATSANEGIPQWVIIAAIAAVVVIVLLIT